MDHTVLPANYTMPASTFKAFTRWRHHWLWSQTSNCSLLLIYWPQKDERLSWPSWLTYSGWFTYTSGDPSSTVPLNQPNLSLEYVTLTFDLLTPKVDQFMPLPHGPHLCQLVQIYSKYCVTEKRANKQLDEWMDRLKELRLCLPV